MLSMPWPIPWLTDSTFNLLLLVPGPALASRAHFTPCALGQMCWGVNVPWQQLLTNG